MIPTPGMTGIYININCSLIVEVVSYEEENQIVKLKVLKSLLKNCNYEEGDEFEFYLRKNQNDLEEKLILD
ncbi:MAG: hypothetical protein KatS3mg001_470 [Candidatus Pacearchaeota archaeon]|nr:MAG: hypothetical protein KatS3mg001_470 [Candidatus Pacearchaeota archaeon]